jgi:hypothetical protein
MNDNNMSSLEINGLPPKSAFKEAQFSTIKTRRGEESVPFLNLPMGEHEVTFKGKRKVIKCIVKTWLSCYGYAWQVIKEIKCITK